MQRDYDYAPAEIELDVPYNGEAILNNSEVKKLDREQVELQEQIKQNNYDRWLRKNAIKLLKIILILLFAYYAIDIVLTNCQLKNSVSASSIFELLKFVASTLVGFVFANSIKKE